MRTKKLKWGNPLFVIFLAIAGIFGVSSAFVNKHVQADQIAQKADATVSVVAGTKLWFRRTSAFDDGSAKLYYNYNDSANTGSWHWGEITSSETTTGGETLYYHVMECTPSTFQIQRRGPNGSYVWETWEPSKSLSNNLMQVTNKNCDVQGASVTEFYFATPTNGSVTLTAFDSSNTNKGNLDTNTTYYTYSDWHVTYSASPSTGHTFSNWTYYDSSSSSYVSWGSGATTNPTTINNSTNINHSANFSASTYTVTLDRQSGTTGSTSVTATYGSAMPSATMPARTGYTFGGYYTETGGSGTKYYNANGSSANDWTETSVTKLYAKWTANTTSVTLDNQDATTAGATSVTATYDANMPSIEDNLPEKTNYIFEGYFTGTNGSGKQYYNADGTSANTWTETSVTKLYAKWICASITVTLDRQSGTTGSTSVTADFGEDMPSATMPTRTGYTFGGYYTETGGNGTKYYNADGSSAKACDFEEDTTLYAKWTANEYTVTYDGNEGTPSADNKTVTFGSAYGTLASATRTGYTFAGWYTAAVGGSVVTSSTTVTTADNHDLYAHWTINSHTLTWNFNGGTPSSYSPSAGSVDYGTTITKPETITKTGYTFSSWTGYVATMPDSDLTITANFTADTYTIAFDGNGSTSGSTASVTATYDAERSLTANGFSKTGYHFTGWATSSSGDVVYTNQDTLEASEVNEHYADVKKGGTLTLYAVWEINTYTITYDRNKNSGLQATQTKTHGVDANAYTLGDEPLTADGWNPSDGKYFKHWNTGYNDDLVSYDEGDTITTDEAFYLYYIEDWFDYRYSIDGGSYVYLTSHSNVAGALQQFSPATAQDLPLHGKFAFEVNKHDGEGWQSISVSYEDGCNYDVETGIKLNVKDTIFLKHVSGTTYKVWVPGITDYTVRVNGSDAYAMVGAGTSGGGKEQMVATTLVYGQKDQILEVGNNGNYYRGYRNSGCDGIEERTVSGSTNLYFTTTGMYTVYLIKQDGAHWDNIYVSRNEEKSAAKFATIFNSTIGGVCSGVLSGESDLEDLQEAWGTTSSSGLNAIYQDYSAAAKKYLSGETSTTDADILACIAKYNYIENKYGTSALPNFFGREDSYKSAFNGFSPFNMFGESSEESLSTIIIIAASGVALLSVTALSVLAIKKRKNKEE